MIARMRLGATAAAALATITATVSVLPLFAGPAWVPPTLVAIALMALTGALARGVGLPPPLQPIAQLLVLLTWLTWLFVQPAAALGFLPGPMAISELQDLTRTALAEAETVLSPVPTDPTLVFLAVGGLGLVALVVDVIGVTLRLPALAGAPLLLVYALPAAVITGGVTWWLLPIAVSGWLLLMAVDSRDDARTWGPLIPRQAAMTTSSGPRAHPRAARASAWSGLLALQAAVVAILAAVLLPNLIPGLSEPVFVSSSGSRPGIGDAGSISIDPFVTLRRDLVDNPEREVLRYTTDSPAPDYLRLIALDEFDGETWRASEPAVRTPLSDGLEPPDAPGVAKLPDFTAAIAISDLDNAQLPVPYAATAVSGVGEPLDDRWTWDPQTRTVAGSGVSAAQQNYTVTAYQLDPTRAELRNASKRAPDQLLPWLALPDGITPDMARIADEVTAGAQTPYAKARALVDYFTRDGGYSYSTQVITPDGADPLQSFLDERIGYCQQFAGTMALMARSVGIPSRVVIGFTSGVEDDNGEYVVQARNAHAWPELWMSGIGWVRFEPTPRIGAGVTQPDYGRSRNATPEATPEPTAPTPTPADRVDAAAANTSGSPLAWWPVAAIGGVLLLLIAIPHTVIRLRRRRRTSLADPRARIEATWQEWGDEARDLGWRWSPADTPRQASNRLAAQLPLGEPERAALRRLVWWVEQLRYAVPDQVLAPGPSELRADLAVLRKAAWTAADRSAQWRSVVLPASLVGRGEVIASEPESAREPAETRS